jgi:hypothetical protein
MNKQDHDDGAILLALAFTLSLGLWLGFSMGTAISGIRATVPMLARQIGISLMGE